MRAYLLSFLCAIILLASNLQAGEVSFEVVPSSQVLSVGDTLTLTVRITIYDSPENFDVEPLSTLELPGFTTISTAPRHKKGKDGDKFYEERITTFKLIADSEGTYKIPAFEIPYSSQESDTDQVLTSQVLDITVYQGKTGMTPMTAFFMILVFAIVVLITVVGFLVWFKHIKSKQFKAEENEQISTKFEVWSEELSQHLANGKKDTFTQQANNYVNEYIEYSYQLGLKGQKYEKRILLMKAKKVSPALMELFDLTYNILEEKKYSGQVKDSDELQEVLRKLQEIEKFK